MLLRPTENVRVDDGGRRLVGGSPLTAITLSAAGADLVEGWFGGTPVGPDAAHRQLAQRLIETDMATMTSAPSPPPSERLAVIIPVKDDLTGLAATLASIAQVPPAGRPVGPLEVVIVDDGSDPAVDPGVGAELDVPVTVTRRASPSGPGNARNHGTFALDTTALVFADAGVRISRDQLAALTLELMTGDTVAVAPRVRSEQAPTVLARYERRWSPLDMGPDPGLVGPGRRISYVPSTCLAVRASTFDSVGGFDPALRFGEDVDLIWRLGARGWVRYVPHIEVTHPPRRTITRFLRQRFEYGTSAGPLARRHGSTVAPARLDGGSALALGAVIAGHPLPGLLVAGWSTARHFMALVRCRIAPALAARMITARWIALGRGLVLALARTWWPVTLLAAAKASFRPAPLLLVLGWSRRLGGHQSQPDGRAGVAAPVERGTDMALGILDDSAYALGVWRGSIGSRTIRPLLPHILFKRSAPTAATGR